MSVLRITTRSYGKSGLATVKVKANQYDVTFADDQWKVVIEKEDAPDDVREGECYVSLDEHNTKILSIRPPAKAYYGKFVGFWAKDGELPIYRQIPYSPPNKVRNFEIPAHLETTAQFKIIDDKKWEGFIVTMPVVYCFVDYMQSGVVALKGWGSKKAEEFLVQCGIDFMKDTIPYSENILPTLQDMLREKDVKLLLTIKEGGWIKSIVTAP